MLSRSPIECKSWMAFDRFVYFKGERAPSKTSLEEVLTDFCGALATKIEWNEDRWYVTLHGHVSHMFQRQPDAYKFYDDRNPPERWFEVWVKVRRRDKKVTSMDVITRMADEATNALAEAFTERCAVFWGGEREEQEDS